MKEQFLLRKVKDNCFILSNCPIKVVGGAISSNTLRLVDTLDHLINIFYFFCMESFQLGSACFNKHNSYSKLAFSVLNWTVFCLKTWYWVSNISLIMNYYHTDWRERTGTNLDNWCHFINSNCLKRVARWAIWRMIIAGSSFFILHSFLDLKFMRWMLCLRLSLLRSYQHNNHGPLPNNSLNF